MVLCSRPLVRHWNDAVDRSGDFRCLSTTMDVAGRRQTVDVSNEPARRRDCTGEAAGGARHAARARPAASRGLPRRAVRVDARRRAALHAADGVDWEVGRRARGAQAPPGLSTASARRRSIHRGHVAPPPISSTPAAVHRETERRLSQPQHFRPTHRYTRCPDTPLVTISRIFFNRIWIYYVNVTHVTLQICDANLSRLKSFNRSTFLIIKFAAVILRNNIIDEIRKSTFWCSQFRLSGP